jgi:DNA-binding cell septation regulator SpoVG
MTKENTAPSLSTIIGMMQGRLKATIEFLDAYHPMTSSSTRQFIVDVVKESLQKTIDDAEEMYIENLNQLKNN